MIMKAFGIEAGTAIALEAGPMRNEPVSNDESEMRAMRSFVTSILAAAEESASRDSFVAARRRILRDLEQYGPQSIASLPRAWPVTMQHVRTLVSGLEEDGLIESADEVRGQPLYRLTANGSRALAATRSTQLRLVARLLQAADNEDTTLAVSTYRTLRTALDAPSAERQAVPQTPAPDPSPRPVPLIRG